MAEKLKNYIAGEWVEVSNSATLPVVNPATCEVLAETPVSGAAEVNAVVEAAAEAYEEWRRTPVIKRARYLHTYKELLEERFEDLAELIVKENGKTRDEARGEVLRGIESVEFAFGVPSLMTGFKMEDMAAGIDETAERQPIGVFAALTPFNFPMMVPLWFYPTAIACGNTFILKPSPMTPLSAQLLMEIWEDTGAPEGVLNLLHGDGDTAAALMAHPDVKGVSFVGSTRVGKIVYETCAKHGKRVQVQGGAKNYLAVMPDADLEKTVANVLGSAYGCAGQRCLAGSVLVAVGDVYEPLRDEMKARAERLTVGYGLDESAQMGTVVNEQAKTRIHHMIEEGVKEGAELLLDGRGVQVEGYEEGSFVGPTLFDGVTPEMSIAQEEIFGPVLGIMRVPDFDTAVEVINASRYGNAASIFTNNGHYAREFKYRVRAGNIGVNIGVAAPAAWFPFGGQKDSFLGDTHGQGPDAIQFYTDYKVVIERWFDED